VGGAIHIANAISRGEDPSEGLGRAMMAGAVAAASMGALELSAGGMVTAGARTDGPATGVRYMSEGEAGGIQATGRIANVDGAGRPRPIHYTMDSPLESAAAAQAKYHLPTPPTHYCTFPGCSVQNSVAPAGTVAADATQAATSLPVNNAGRPIPLKP